ncbi:MAG: 2-amino-4-hydroxy-6-hydroxymethyldihydropteridine diphosphokinase [Devosiaceae bacterium]|nr:2-amino-4-hydroxy-6-hydroxymethyldihydropteridine diphosphokinase [Devosiaceae bacterium]
MTSAWLSLGANLENPRTQLKHAATFLNDHINIEVIAHSDVLKNPAWGKTDQPDFHNIALEIKTTLSPVELLDACQSIENKMGRVRREKWGPRLIDIDIVAYDRIIMQTPRLTLPHPFAHERDFVLEPLSEISPETKIWICQLAGN